MWWTLWIIPGVVLLSLVVSIILAWFSPSTKMKRQQAQPTQADAWIEDDVDDEEGELSDQVD